VNHTHRRRQAAAATALALAGILALAFALELLPPSDRSSVGTSTGSPRLVTPLVSARRAPGAVVDAIGSLRLTDQLARVDAGLPSCTTVHDGAAPVTTADADAALVPASTLKLLTAAAAVDLLGPDARFTTAAVADGDPTAVRSLTLVGGGDPVLRTPTGIAAIAADRERRDGVSTDLATLADRIVSAGVRSLPEGITVDDSRFDAVRYHPSWPDSYRAGGTIGPVGALAIDEGYADPRTRLSVVGDPAIATGEALRTLLVARGVRVGPVARGRAPEGAAPVASITSPPLSEIAGSILAASNNHGAEVLLKDVAVHAGRPGTSEAGSEVARARLERLGVPTAGLVMVDGSGLSRENRASCATLDATVRLGESERLRVLRDGLAVAGERGTLAERLGGTALAGRVVAKTGTLDGVSGLAGTSRVRRPLRFALLVNGTFGEARAYALREAMAAAIARYPDVNDGVASVPPPDAVPTEG
jgi:D-alanyl-D-alanine carboxypeptidase/D-alanyl-D-alanine-endopeptidase (penicillin-binding protein 4)